MVRAEHKTFWAFRRRQACGQNSALPELDDLPPLAKKVSFARHLSPLSVRWEFLKRRPQSYPLFKTPGGLALVKVCIGGGAGTGFVAGVTTACGFATGSLSPLIIRPFQLVHCRLLVAKRPPPFSDHLHGGRGRSRSAGWLAQSRQTLALQLPGGGW